jgi:DNA-binding transcriptional MerR regulator
VFRIAAYANLAGVSAKTLRAWDELGLFRPAWTDEVTGYRYYSPVQLPELRRILALRDLGLPLAQVTELVAGGADLRPVLERRRRELEAERREIERRLQALQISVAMAEAGSAGPDVVLQPVPRELVATLAVGPDGDDSAAFYRLEAVVRGLGLRANRPPAMLVHPPGPDGPLPDEVAVPVTARFASQGGIEVRELPACRVAAAVHRGPYAGLPDAQAALERWVAAAGFPVTGRLRILYLQFGAEPELRVPTAYLVERAEDFVTELQLELA